MSGVIQFFNDIKTDISITYDTINNEFDRIQATRICSIAMKIFGSLAAFQAAGLFLIGASTLIAGSTAPALNLLVLAAIGVFLAHDMIQTGINQRNLISLNNVSSSNNCKDATKKTFNGLCKLGKAAIQEQLRGTPATIHGTWVLEPLYRLITHCTSLGENQ